MKVWVACAYDSPPHAAYAAEHLAAHEKCHVFELEVIGMSFPPLDKLEIICSEALSKNVGQSAHINAHEVALSMRDIENKIRESWGKSEN